MVKGNVTEKLNTTNHIIGDALPPEACHIVGEDGGLLCELALPVSAMTLSFICWAC